jgi:hypothetical protein
MKNDSIPFAEFHPAVSPSSTRQGANRLRAFPKILVKWTAAPHRRGLYTQAITALAVLCCGFLATAAPDPDLFSVRDFGAKGDGKTDDTTAFQKALDAAGQAGGGVVFAPRGNYFFAGHLDVPRAVTLKGLWESVPSHVGIRDQGASKPTDAGTTFLVTESQGKLTLNLGNNASDQ